MTRNVKSQLRLVTSIPLTDTLRSHTVPELLNGGHMQKYVQHMRNMKMSEITIEDRIEVLTRLRDRLLVPLLEATEEHLTAYQATYSHLAPASVDIYTRHIKAYFAWASSADLISRDPAAGLILPILRRGLPHPTQLNDLRTILACARGHIHAAYVLAAFAGLRCGEICRLQGRDISHDSGAPIALIHGKGGKQRRVPILPPVMAEIGYGRGWIITKGRAPVTPRMLSIDSSRFLHELGIDTTLHSMRGTFATQVGRMTKDPTFVMKLLGHESLNTTMIYMGVDMTDAHVRLTEFAALASGFIDPPHLSVVSA